MRSWRSIVSAFRRFGGLAGRECRDRIRRAFGALHANNPASADSEKPSLQMIVNRLASLATQPQKSLLDGLLGPLPPSTGHSQRIGQQHLLVSLKHVP